MNSTIQIARVNQAIEVFQHTNNGMTVVDACKEVGLARSSYYDILNKYPEAIAEYQEMLEANARIQMGMILSRKTEILHKIIEDGLSENTSPRDRLAIYKMLDEIAGRLENALPLEDKNERAAREFLRQGPTLSIQKSRLTATQTTTVMIESEG